LEPETFKQAILGCPSREGARAPLLHGVTSVSQEAPLRLSLPLMKTIPASISVTSMGFPQTMFPPPTPPSSPPFSLSPSNLPPPVFRVFSLAEASE